LGKNLKWFLTTAGVGLIPFLARFVVYLSLNEKGVFQLITISDIVVWGLIVNICIWSEKDRFFKYNPNLRSFITGVSVVFIYIYGFLLWFALINEGGAFTREGTPLINIYNIFLAGFVLDGVTLLMDILLICICHEKPEKKPQDKNKAKGEQ